MADDSKHRHLTAFRPAVARRRGERRIAAARHASRAAFRASTNRSAADFAEAIWLSSAAMSASGKSALALAFAIRVVAARNARRVSHGGDGRRARPRAHHRDRGAHDGSTTSGRGRSTKPPERRAGGVALRLREHLPIVERLSAGAGIDGVATPHGRAARGRPRRRGLARRACAGRFVRTTRSSRQQVRQLKELALDRDVAILATVPLPAARRSRRSTPDARRFRCAGFGETDTLTSCSDCSDRTCTSPRETSRARPSC